ncbi:MAG: glycosyltransferase family 25 protein [Pseudomonadota bacterium]
MKIQVINLDKRVDRWERVRKRLDAAELQYSRLSATTPETLPEAARKGVESMPEGLQISDVELACFCSHIRAIEQIVIGDDSFGIIMEDDAVLAPSFKTAVTQLTKHMAVGDVVRLERVNPRMRLRIPAANISKDLQIFGLDRFDPGCGAYIVEREAAKRLVSNPYKSPIPIDLWLFDLQFPKPAGVRCRQLVPAISIQQHLADGVPLEASDSDIHHVRMHRVDELTVPGPQDNMSFVLREWLRLTRRLKMMARRFRAGNPVFYRSRKMHVPFADDKIA